VLPVAGKGLADALGEAFDAYVSVHQGCITSATIASRMMGVFTILTGDRRACGGSYRRWAVVSDARFPTASYLVGRPARGVHSRTRGRDACALPPVIDGPHVLGVAGVGMLRVLVDGTPLAEAKPDLRRDS